MYYLWPREELFQRLVWHLPVRLSLNLREMAMPGKNLKGSYIELAKLSNALTEASLSTERGPLLIKLEEGQLRVFDWDGKEITVIKGQRHG